MMHISVMQHILSRKEGRKEGRTDKPILGVGWSPDGQWASAGGDAGGFNF